MLLVPVVALLAALADRGLATPGGLEVPGVFGLADPALLADSGRGLCRWAAMAGERTVRPAEGLATPGAGDEGFPAAPELSLLRRVDTLATAALAGRGEAGVLVLKAGAFFSTGDGVLGPGVPLLSGAGLFSLGVVVPGEGLGVGDVAEAGLLAC